MKQSSIDWLINHMETAYFPTFEEIEKAKQKAREMHRQEIKDCSSENYSYGFYDGEEGVHLRQESSENYYTETFNP